MMLEIIPAEATPQATKNAAMDSHLALIVKLPSVPPPVC